MISVSMDLPILPFCINAIIKYVTFWIWLLSITLKFISVMDLSVYHYFLFLNNIPLCVYSTIYSSSHLLMNVWVISSHAATNIYLQMFEYLFSILLGIYLKVEMLGHMGILEDPPIFQQKLNYFTFPLAI